MPTEPEQYRRAPKRYVESEDRKARKAFYQSRQWKKLRARLLKKRAAADQIRAEKLFDKYRDKYVYEELADYRSSGAPLCIHCLEEDRLTAGAVLDHIVAIADGGSELDPDNLQFLCKSHHNRKSRLEEINRTK